MGKRLTKIATRTGDDGTTGLGDGSRTRKDAARIAALGDVDELNCALGVLLAEGLPDDVRAALVTIQHELFDLGGELSIPGHALLAESAVLRLDEWLAHYNAPLPALQEFVLPGGCRAAALAHMARADLPPRGTLGGGAGGSGIRRRGAPVPEPAVRSAVRAGARAQPRERRRRRAVAARVAWGADAGPARPGTPHSSRIAALRRTAPGRCERSPYARAPRAATSLNPPDFDEHAFSMNTAAAAILLAALATPATVGAAEPPIRRCRR